MADSFSVEAYLKAVGVDQFAKDFQKARESVGGMDESADKAGVSIGGLVKSIAGIAAAVGVFHVLRNAVDLAFNRIDTMEQFERVMTEMTGSTAKANDVLNQTNGIVTGTAYGLDVAAKAVQDFVTRGVEVEDATKYIEAWGDAVAFYGNGSNEQFANVTNALQNMLTKGKVGMDQLNRLFEAGIPAVDIYAQATGRSVDEVSKALSDGEISAEDFVNTVTTAMMEGTNGVKSIAGSAKEAGASWSGTFANMGAAAARGVTSIIQAIDNMLTSNGLPTMREMVGQFGSFMESTMKTAAAVIEPVGNALFGLLGIFKPLLSVLKPFVPVIGATVAAFTGMMIVKSVGTALLAFRATLMGIPVIQAAVTAATAATSLAMATFSGSTAAAGTATVAFSGAMVGLRAALGALMGPVGWFITITAGIAAAGYAIYNAFNKTSGETERLKGETESLSKANESLIDSMNESAGAYQDRVRDIDATYRANSDLIQTVDELSKIENKSADDKRDLSVAVAQLNGEVEGLTVSYNEEADMLSESVDKMRARIDLMNEQDKANAAQERLTEILKEQQSVELQLEEINGLREHWNSLIEKGGKDADAAKVHIANLDLEEKELISTLEALGVQYEVAKQIAVEASSNAKDIIADNNQDLIFSYDDLEGKTKEAFDAMSDRYSELKDAATDAFNEIETKTDHTLESMIETMQHNTEAVREWGENQAALMKWAGENSHENFIPYIEQMGIDQAAELAVMADNLDESNKDQEGLLGELAEAYYDGGGAATEAMKTSLGEGFEGVIDALETLVDRMDTTLRALINEADWEQYGIEPPNQIENGVKSGIDGVEQASKSLVERSVSVLESSVKNKDIKSIGKVYPVDFGDGIISYGSYAITAAANMSNDVYDAAYEPLWRENFVEIGAGVGIGLGIGIDNNAVSAISAASNLGTAVLGAASAALEVNSPSRAMIRIGKFVVDGLRNGINSSEFNAINAMVRMNEAMLRRAHIGMEMLNRTMSRGVDNINRTMRTLPVVVNAAMTAMQGRLSTGATRSLNIMSRLSTNMISPFRNTRGQLASVGSSAMSGLQAGLNGGAGRVMATARSIASRVASTMRSALKINSPSHVMRDDVGRWIPEGIAVGIERYAGEVYSVIDDMASYIAQPFEVGAPQFDIAGQIASTNAQIQSRVSHELNHQGDYTAPQPANINLTLGGKDYSTFVDDITHNQQRKQNRLRPKKLS